MLHNPYYNYKIEWHLDSVVSALDNPRNSHSSVNLSSGSLCILEYLASFLAGLNTLFPIDLFAGFPLASVKPAY